MNAGRVRELLGMGLLWIGTKLLDTQGDAPRERERESDDERSDDGESPPAVVLGEDAKALLREGLSSGARRINEPTPPPPRGSLAERTARARAKGFE